MKKAIEKAKKYDQIKQESPRKESGRKELEKKVLEGAHKALKEYGRVFERLSQYDRT